MNKEERVGVLLRKVRDLIAEGMKKLMSIQELAEVDTEVWRPAEVQDVIRALQGENVECRCRDDDSDPWSHGVLIGGAIGTDWPWCCRCDYDDPIWQGVPKSWYSGVPYG